MIDISEIFHSLQGEGLYIGTSSIFIRLSHCNLACCFCDANYTWNWEGTDFQHKDNIKFNREKETHPMSVGDIMQKVREIRDNNFCNHIVVTGGEPLIQHVVLTPLFKELVDLGLEIEIETNGTIVPNEQFNSYITHYTVSPKLTNSNNPEKLRDRKRAIEFFIDQRTAFKFVVCDEKDMEEIRSWQEKYHVCNEDVYLMPEGRTAEEVSQKSGWIADICKKYGYKFSTRLQILLWGNQRGT